jgi:hypothetical protein
VSGSCWRWPRFSTGKTQSHTAAQPSPQIPAELALQSMAVSINALAPSDEPAKKGCEVAFPTGRSQL